MPFRSCVTYEVHAQLGALIFDDGLQSLHDVDHDAVNYLETQDVRDLKVQC